MENYLIEFIGTAFLIAFGSSIIAGVTLNKSLSQGSSWLLICLGWAFAVMIAVFISLPSGAHLNPAVTIALAVDGAFPWSDVLPYIIAQVIGAFVGASVTVVHYYTHFKVTPQEVNTKGIFCTGPAIKNTPMNLLSEIIATFSFIFSVLCLIVSDIAPGLYPMIVGLLIFVIGVAFGPTTGFAINPARDFGPRLAYALLPIPNKSSADWGYAWIPIVGPVIGSVLAVGAYGVFF